MKDNKSAEEMLEEFSSLERRKKVEKGNTLDYYSEVMAQRAVSNLLHEQDFDDVDGNGSKVEPFSNEDLDALNDIDYNDEYNKNIDTDFINKQINKLEGEEVVAPEKISKQKDKNSKSRDNEVSKSIDDEKYFTTNISEKQKTEIEKFYTQAYNPQEIEDDEDKKRSVFGSRFFNRILKQTQKEDKETTNFGNTIEQEMEQIKISTPYEREDDFDDNSLQNEPFFNPQNVKPKEIENVIPKSMEEEVEIDVDVNESRKIFFNPDLASYSQENDPIIETTKSLVQGIKVDKNQNEDDAIKNQSTIASTDVASVIPKEILNKHNNKQTVNNATILKEIIESDDSDNNDSKKDEEVSKKPKLKEITSSVPEIAMTSEVSDDRLFDYEQKEEAKAETEESEPVISEEADKQTKEALTPEDIAKQAEEREKEKQRQLEEVNKRLATGMGSAKNKNTKSLKKTNDEKDVDGAKDVINIMENANNSEVQDVDNTNHNADEESKRVSQKTKQIPKQKTKNNKQTKTKEAYQKEQRRIEQRKKLSERRKQQTNMQPVIKGTTANIPTGAISKNQALYEQEQRMKRENRKRLEQSKSMRAIEDRTINEDNARRRQTAKHEVVRKGQTARHKAVSSERERISRTAQHKTANVDYTKNTRSKSIREGQERSNIDFSNSVLGLASIICIILAIFIIKGVFFNDKYDELLVKYEKATEEIVTMEEEITTLKAKIDELTASNVIDEDIIGTEDTLEPDDAVDIIESEVDETTESNETENNSTNSTNSTYIVQDGDTLGSIAIDLYGGYEGVDIIKEANGLTSDSLSLGQELLIP